MLLITICIVSFGQAFGAPPDLTNGGVPGDSISTNLGPTGLRGWVYHVREDSSESRQIQIKSVSANSSASGIFAANDVILGASGTGAAPVNFTYDARRAFADALNDAEARNPATLELIRWRAGTTTTVTLTLRTMGSYSATAPYNCPKSALILEEGLQFIQGGGESAGMYSFGTLALVAGNDPNNPNNAARITKAQSEARAKVPSASVRATMMSDDRDITRFAPWDRGHTLIMLAEYYLLTGDTQVLPGIEAYAVNIAKNQSLLGTTGHMYAHKNKDGSANGSLGNGYGCVNSAAMPCYLGLLLAKKCGLTNPEIAQGIQRASRFYAYYSGKGAIPYGEHESYWQAHENNGKSGLAAICFGLEPTRSLESKFFSRMAIAAASERGEGHTGAFFNYLWAPLGAAVGGQEAAVAYFANTRWMFDLARLANGSFVYDCLSGEGPNSGASYNDFRMSTAILLTYALPLRQLEITGKNQPLPANTLTSVEVAAAAAADRYDPDPRTTTELIADLGSWSPRVHRYAAIELATRSIDSATLAQITALANDVNGTSRYGACLALGEITTSSTATARADTLVALLSDPDGHVRFMAAEAMRSLPQATKMAHLNTLLTLCASQALPLLPLPENDPMQLAHGRLCMLLFSSDGGVISSSFEGVGRTLLLPAIRAAINHPNGRTRSSNRKILSMLNQQETLEIADSLVNSVECIIPSDRMFGRDTQSATIAKLAQYKIAEGVPLSQIIINREDTKFIKEDILTNLQFYGGSSTTINPDPQIIPFLELLKQDPDTADYAQTVLDAIAADPNPEPAQPLKSIPSISADAPSITLPTDQTILRATGFDYAKGNPVFTWRKIHGKSDPTFTPNANAAAKDTTLTIGGLPGKYRFEVTMSDSRGFTEVTRMVDVSLLDSNGSLPPNSPPVANDQSINVTRGISSPITLTAADPEGFPLNYRIATAPSDGEITGTPPNLTYLSNRDGFAASDSFTFEAIDSEGDTSTATVAINIDNSVRAEGILWGAPTHTTGPTNIATVGTFVDSRTGDDNSGTITVNSVPFLQGRILNNSGSFLSNLCPDTGTGTENIALESLLDRISSVGGSFQVSGLVPGSKYLIQIFLCDYRSSNKNLYLDDGGISTNGVTLNTNVTGVFGQHVIGTFTAGAESQTIRVTAQSGDALISAWQLRLLPDGASPTPSPLTWATLPTAQGLHTINMTATTATDSSGVEYFFEEISGNPGGTDSGWQDSPLYTDTSLSPGTTYTYRVTARDKSYVKNATIASLAASATTGSSILPPPTVWNVNIGNEITTSDNFMGAATENSANSTWNSITNPLPKTNVELVTSSGLASTARLDISAANGGNNRGMGSQNLTSGPEIFRSFIGGAGTTATVLFHGLPANHTYDIIIYSDWYWKNGDSGYPVTQTIGTGLSGTIYTNRIFTPYVNGQVPPLQEDTNPLNSQANVGNWYRIRTLTPDANGQLGFRLGDGVNGPINGFQLIGFPIDPGDLTPPSPNPMTFAIAPHASDTTSISMTAITATDMDGVEYFFDETSGSFGGTDSGWQDSPTYTDTGLNSTYTYTYTVTARDKSPAQNATATSAPASATLTASPPPAFTVWNVNVGNSSAGAGGASEITTGDNYLGAASENSANSTWNAVTTAAVATLADSTGSTAAGVTFTVAPTAGVVLYGAQNVTGDEIFDTWIRDDNNNDPFTVSFGNLPTLGSGESYSLVVYSDWWWKNSTGGQPISQTAGTGLTGAFILNRYIGGTSSAPADVPFGTVTALAQDTNPANVNGQTNFARFNGLTPDGSNNLSFSMGDVNGPINGFQLIKVSSSTPDTTPPTPSPMTFASAPAPAGQSSITMTATAATDASDVEYFFDETSGNFGGTDSGWQNSPSYTDTGLSASTTYTYTYTVTARDKSPAQNATATSAPASASVTASPPPAVTVWNVQFASQSGNQITTGDNFIGAATENTANSTWNRVSSIPQTGMVLKKSTSEDTSITLDFSGGSINTQNLVTGDKIFNSRVGGGTTSNLTLKGLTLTNSYDIVLYSDWWWRNGDSLPITQTLGNGLTGIFHLNRELTGTAGNVPALARDTNPANVTSGSGNVGNWMRVNGLRPTLDGELAFRFTDGNNAPFNGFQLIATPLAPKADILSLRLASNPLLLQEAVINETAATATLTVPFGTNLTNLAPDYVLWPGATCTTPSGTARNFTTPQTYTITSSDSLVTKNYSVSVVVAPPLPEFTLSAPANWDGRTTITAQPVISNLALLQANGGTNFTYNWTVNNVAVTQTTSPSVMTLTRAQGNGSLLVTLTMTNGTLPVTSSTTISVQQPASDPWVERSPLNNEKPVTGQFLARNPFTNLGTIYYRGTQSGTPDDVFLKVYRTPSGGSETLHATYRQPLVGGAYDFTATIEAGLFTYRVEYGTSTSSVDSVVATVNNLLCGDAFIIEGQSNAQATDNSTAQEDISNPWVKTYNATLGWGAAYAKPTSPNWGSKVGFWGMKLAQDIVAEHSMPVCLINGAVGGTYIAQHQPNPANRTVGAGTYDIYANLLNRVISARLTHGIRGIFWHQGESDSASFGPVLEPDYLSYEQNFQSMSTAWKQDFPNFQRYIMFQIAPDPCGIGPYASEIREVQRQLPRLYSNMSLVNTIAVPGYEGCHYTKTGYENLTARLLAVVKRDFYDVTSPVPLTGPNLIRAYFTSAERTAIGLEFDQPMSWNSFSLPNYFINDVTSLVTSGSASGNVVTLQLSSAAALNSSIDYIKDSWSYQESVSTLLFGSNALPAHTFADVTIQSINPFQSWVSARGLVGVDAAWDADPDQDGIKNAIEFVLGGEPNPANIGSSSNALLPTSIRNGAGDLIFTFKRKLASVGIGELNFQWSNNLIFPAINSVQIGSTSSTTDGITVAISAFDVATDNIVITVPASKAVDGKLFGRIQAVIP